MGYIGIIGYAWRLYRDNGKENGDYFLKGVLRLCRTYSWVRFGGGSPISGPGKVSGRHGFVAQCLSQEPNEIRPMLGTHPEGVLENPHMGASVNRKWPNQPRYAV